jgi:hypothetical protein
MEDYGCGYLEVVSWHKSLILVNEFIFRLVIRFANSAARHMKNQSCPMFLCMGLYVLILYISIS